MVRKLIVFAIFGCLAALSASARIAVAQSDDGPPLYFESNSASSEDAGGPALASPSDSENANDRNSPVNNSRSNHGNYNGSQSQYSSSGSNGAGNMAPATIAIRATPGRNRVTTMVGSRHISRTANRIIRRQIVAMPVRIIGLRPTNSNAQSHWGGYQPGYQQAPARLLINQREWPKPHGYELAPHGVADGNG